MECQRINLLFQFVISFQPHSKPHDSTRLGIENMEARSDLSNFRTDTHLVNRRVGVHAFSTTPPVSSDHSS